MNPLDLLIDMRLGPPWATCVRRTYQLIGMYETYTVECWHDDSHGPVLDAADLRELNWTTANESVLDDGSLSIVDPADAGRHVLIKPLIFQDQNGGMRLGWPMAGYINPAVGERWVLVQESLEDKLLRQVERAVATQTIAATKEFAPMSESLTNGPAHISGIFIVHLSSDEIYDMLTDEPESSEPLIIEDGEIRQTRGIPIKNVVEAAAEKVSPRYADLVADLENAEVSVDPDDGFRVTFTYELDL